jgi:hypothetical protein
MTDVSFTTITGDAGADAGYLLFLAGLVLKATGDVGPGAIFLTQRDVVSSF